jgi:hypothetical protein
MYKRKSRPLSCLQMNQLSLQDSILFVSTLSGSFYAVGKSSGRIHWTIKEGTEVQYSSDKFIACFVGIAGTILIKNV